MYAEKLKVVFEEFSVRLNGRATSGATSTIWTKNKQTRNSVLGHSSPTTPSTTTSIGSPDFSQASSQSAFHNGSASTQDDLPQAEDSELDVVE